MKRSAIFRLMLILIAAMMPLFAVIPAQSQTAVSSASDIAWSPDGTLLGIGGNFGVAIYSSSFEFVKSLSTQYTEELAWSPDGVFLASGAGFEESFTLNIWSMESEQVIATIHIPTARVRSLRWSPDSETLAVVSYTNEIKIYSVITQAAILTISSAYPIQDAAWSPDGSEIAVVAGGRRTVPASPAIVSVWNKTTGTLEFSIDLTATEQIRDISKVAWNPSGTEIALGVGLSPKGSVPLLNRVTQAISVAYEFLLESPSSIQWSPDGTKFIATDAGITGSSMTAWDATTYEQLWTQSIFTDSSTSSGYRGAFWKPDSSQIAVLITPSVAESSQVSVQIIDPNTGDEIAVPELPPVTPTIILEGTLWNDVNQNGLYESQETPLGEIELQLLDSCGTVVQTTSTLANGHYRFEAAPETYTVEINTSDYTLSPMDQGSDDLIDSDFDPVTNRTEPITLTTSESIRLDAGLVSIPISE